MTNQIDFTEIERQVLEKINVSNDELAIQIGKIATRIATLVIAEYHQEVSKSTED